MSATGAVPPGLEGLEGLTLEPEILYSPAASVRTTIFSVFPAGGLANPPSSRTSQRFSSRLDRQQGFPPQLLFEAAQCHPCRAARQRLEDVPLERLEIV